VVLTPPGIIATPNCTPEFLPKIWEIFHFFGFTPPSVFSDSAKPLIFARTVLEMGVGMPVAPLNAESNQISGDPVRLVLLTQVYSGGFAQ